MIPPIIPLAIAIIKYTSAVVLKIKADERREENVYISIKKISPNINPYKYPLFLNFLFNIVLPIKIEIAVETNTRVPNILSLTLVYASNTPIKHVIIVPIIIEIIINFGRGPVLYFEGSPTPYVASPV